MSYSTAMTFFSRSSFWGASFKVSSVKNWEEIVFPLYTHFPQTNTVHNKAWQRHDIEASGRSIFFFVVSLNKLFKKWVAGDWSCLAINDVIVMFTHCLSLAVFHCCLVPAYFNHTIPDSKVHGANMGPNWPHVGPMNIAIWDIIHGFFTVSGAIILATLSILQPCMI